MMNATIFISFFVSLVYPWAWGSIPHNQSISDCCYVCCQGLSG
jgi:hypothetical protein